MDKFLIGCVFLGLLQQCQSPQKAQDLSSSTVAPSVEVEVEESKPLPTTPRMLRRSMYEHGEMLWIYGTKGESRTFAGMYQKLGELLAQNQRSRLSIRVLPDSAVQEEDLEKHSLILVGTYRNNQKMGELSANLPFKLGIDSIILAEKTYSLADRIWNMRRHPNPHNPYLGLSLITSAQDSVVLSYLETIYSQENNRFQRNPWDYELLGSGERLVMGYLSHSPENPWEYQAQSHWDYLNKGLLNSKSQHFTFIQHGAIDPLEQQRIKEGAELAYLSLSKTLGVARAHQKFPVHVFESVEAKGLEIGNTDQAHVEFDKNRVCLVAHKAFPYVNTAPLTQMLIREEWGQAKSDFLEQGLANLFSEPWKDSGVKYWGKKLFMAGAIPPLKELFSAPGREDSQLMRACISALWTLFLKEQVWEGKISKSNFLNWELQGDQVERLEKDWLAYLGKLPEVEVPKTPKVAELNLAFKGFNFAHEGYNIYDGYLSQKAANSLNRMSNLGANSIAIVPYTGTGSINKPSEFGISNFAGGENDESVIMSAHFAQEEGMSTLLKPQIWVRGAWPGDLRMQSQEDWDQFFENYKKWILHYALLAELYEIEVFCIGVELKYTTLEQGEKWRDLIQDIRQVYSGPLVYAANWGEEFEGISFWDELDYVGIDFYYPLGKSNQISSNELRKNLEKELKKVEQVSKTYNKPVLLTEIGFRSIEAPWQMPHEYAGSKSSKVQDQALCYEVVLASLQEQPWCKGIFWWKWPSYIAFTQPQDRGYSPIGKPAEKVVEKWFKNATP
ncbi:MAG: hypothetical protein AAGA10_04590 [Bacteroidota bacterium]